MKEKVHKALSLFIEVMRVYEVAFIKHSFPGEAWAEVLYNHMKPQQQMNWRNRVQMLDDITNLECLIDYDNLDAFFKGFRQELFEKAGIPGAATNDIITWVRELREIRNKEAHHNPISDDDAQTVFMSIKKIARIIYGNENKELEEEIDRLRAKPLAAQSAPIEKQQIEVPQTKQQESNDDDSYIPSWFNNVIPHYDIRTGALDESVFAANLAEVVLGIGRELYIDRTMFFEKTYITNGLKDLANRVIQALNGEETENRVISLMTGFGGGKTHSLISLYHIAKAGKELMHTSVASSLLKEGVKPTFEGAHVAAFTNNTTDVSQGHTTPEGITIHTIWGEIAYQLAGKEGYEIVRKNDEDMIAPSGGIFKKVLEMSTPALILVDELAAYCVTASAKKVGASNLSDQTISFMQTLTEVVAEVPRCMLIVTLPQSNTEVGATQQAQDILTALQNRVIRVGTNVQPVQEDEIYEVIRRRLFESIGDPAIVKKVVEKYGKYYSHLGGVMPSKVTNGTYREVMRKSYPFHPELIEIFRQKWGQDSRFQRTRGVLRLLASIVNDLWQRRTSLVGTQGLIQTSDVNLSNLHSLTGTILNLKGAQWDSVFHADVMGSTSNAYRIDNENPESNMAKYHLAQGVATSIMLSSVAGKHNSFITLSELKLNMVRPGSFSHAEIDNALARLETVAHYLYSNRDGERHYWFESRANVNILINQAKSQISKDAIDSEIEKRLKAQVDGSMPFRVLVCPTSEVPEQKSLTLAILGPQYLCNGQLTNKTKSIIETIAKQKGSTPRTFRNTILYLVCTEQGYNILSDKIRNYLASQKVLDEYGNLERDQREDVLGRKRTADSEVNQALINAYTQVVKFGAQSGFELLPHFSIQASNFKDYLTYDVLTALKDEEWVIRGIGRGMLGEINLVPKVDAPVQVSKLYETFLRYDDKPMITGPDAITNSIQKFVSEGTFNLAHGEPGNWTTIDVGFTSPFLQADDTNAWLVDPSVKMSKPTTSDGDGGSQGDGGQGQGSDPHSDGGGSDTHSGGTNGGSSAPKRYKHVHIQGNIPMEHWTDLFGSFVQTLRNNKLRISVKFDASSTEMSELTENSQLFKSLKESASQLGLDLTTEE